MAIVMTLVLLDFNACEAGASSQTYNLALSLLEKALHVYPQCFGTASDRRHSILQIRDGT